MGKGVPFIDLGAHHRGFAAAFKRAFAELLSSSEFVLGRDVEAFEKEFAAYVGTKHAVGVSNGTDALTLACKALGVGPGDEVIVPAYTYVASALGASFAGATPRFVDVCPDTFNLDPARIEAAVTPKTRAIMPVHLYGHPADMDPVLEIARRRGLKVIEDVAQAHGATYRGRRAGGFGDAACFSFYPSKNLGAIGDGGLVATNDDGVAEKLRMLRNMGQRKKYHHELLGHNNRLDNLQAAILRIKLKRLDRHNKMRQSAAARYAKALAKTGATPPAVRGGCAHVYHIFAILHPKRDAVMEALKAAGVGCGVYYPTPVPLQPCYAHLGHKKGDFPVADRLSAESLALPMFPEITPAQIATVAKVIGQAVSL